MGAIFWSLLFRHTCVCPSAEAHTPHTYKYTLHAGPHLTQRDARCAAPAEMYPSPCIRLYVAQHNSRETRELNAQAAALSLYAQTIQPRSALRNPRHPLRAFLYAALGTPCLVIHVTSGCARPRRSATVCLEREARRAEGLARVILLRPRPLGAALTREEALCLTKGELVRAPGLHQGACVGFGHA